MSEESKENSVAGSFPGISKNEVDSALQSIRQSVAALINPAPHFEARVLWGPCPDIGLAEDCGVIVIHVPWSPNTPHVHKSGRIYRRVADGSEPMHENDRFALDRLWHRADDLRKEYRDWVKRSPELSKGEEGQPYVRLLLIADLWDDRDAWTNATLSEIREIMGSHKAIASAIPFDNVYTTARGFVARQLGSNDPYRLGLTWQFRSHLLSEVLIPLNTCAPDNIELLPYELDGYANINRYTELLKANGHTTPQVADLNFLFNILLGIVETHERLLASANWRDGYFAKAQILNVWRTVPFMDIPKILDEFETHGVPMLLDSEVITPSGTDPETFVKISRYDEMDTEFARILTQAVLLFSPIARAFGIPAWIESDLEADAEGPFYHDELISAGRRAWEVQRLRNERQNGD